MSDAIFLGALGLFIPSGGFKWIIEALGESSRARGYTVLQLVFVAPVVLLLVWLFARTFR